MARSIEREFVRLPNLALTTSVSTTAEIPMEGYAGGMIYIPTGSPITTLTFSVASRSQLSNVEKAVQSALSSTDAVTPVALLSDSNVAITRTVAGPCAVRIPLECFAAGSIYITVNSAGSVDVSLKG